MDFDSLYQTNASLRNSRRWIIALDSLPHVSLRNHFLYHLYCNYEYNVWSDIRLDCFELFTWFALSCFNSDENACWIIAS